MLVVDTLQDIEKYKTEGKRGLIHNLTTLKNHQRCFNVFGPVSCFVIQNKSSGGGTWVGMGEFLSPLSGDGRMGSGVWTAIQSSWCSKMAGRSVSRDKEHAYTCPTLCRANPFRIWEGERIQGLDWAVPHYRL